MIDIISSQDSNILLDIIAFLIAIMFSFSVHEYSHARVAYANGDDTAYLSGRMTLNPLSHIDPIGFLTLILFGFGWAKPVPINPNRFRDKKTGTFATSFAGIVANFFTSFFASAFYVLFSKLTNMVPADHFASFLFEFLQIVFLYLSIINLNLALFNLLPVPPLDGFNILTSIAKPRSKFVNFMYRYHNVISIIVILICFMTSIIAICSNFLLVPFVEFWKFVWVF